MQVLNKIKKINSNDLVILKNIISAFAIKGLGLAISLLSTPAFISYFNDNKVLGVWYTLLSILIWFLNFDLGIGNGIRNNLVKAFTIRDNKLAKFILSSGLFSISIVTIILSIIGIGIINLTDLNQLLNISSDIVSAEALYISAIFIFMAIMIRFLLTTVSSIFYALQMSSVNNFLGLCMSILQLIYVMTARFDTVEDSLIYLSFSYLFFSNAPVLFAGIVLFFTKLKNCRPSVSYIKKEHIRDVLKIGGIFFFCQIMYMCIVSTNEFFITNIFGPQYTTDYTFYYKINSLLSMLVTLAMTPLWSMVTKVIVNGDWKWLAKLYKRIKFIGVLITIAEFISILFFQFIMDIWLGEHSIVVDYKIAFAFACFGTVFVYSSMLSTIVCGMARMKLQAICYAVGVVFKFIFIIVVSKFTNDWSIVVWSNVFLLFPYCVLQQLDLNKLINSKLVENN